MEATEHISCSTCEKSFRALESLEQHNVSTGHDGQRRKTKQKKKQQKPRLPPPPFPNANGTWVKREKFNGAKSFGYFTCSGCSTWTSAHAYSQYRQECKTCNRSYYAKYFWENEDNNFDDYSSDDDEADKEQKPHMRHLCEACRLGVCDVSDSW